MRFINIPVHKKLTYCAVVKTFSFCPHRGHLYYCVKVVWLSMPWKKSSQIVKKSRCLVDTFGSKIFSLSISVSPRGKWMLPFLFFLALFFLRSLILAFLYLVFVLLFVAIKLAFKMQYNIKRKWHSLRNNTAVQNETK